MSKYTIFKAEDDVFVVLYGKILSLKVESPEWWVENKDQPVYYNLKDSNGEFVGSKSGAGNWHFQDVFATKKEAEGELAAINKEMADDLVTDESFSNDWKGKINE